MEPVWHAATDPAGDAAGVLAARLKGIHCAADVVKTQIYTSPDK